VPAAVSWFGPLRVPIEFKKKIFRSCPGETLDLSPAIHGREQQGEPRVPARRLNLAGLRGGRRAGTRCLFRFLPAMNGRAEWPGYYRSQEKEFHHEEHEEHEEEKRQTIFSGFGPSSFLRVLRFFVILFS
jgi:hypothetical protein